MSTTLLEIRDLHTTFQTKRGPITAVDGVSLGVHRGRVTALVGESGCGKSATALSILRLLPTSAQIVGGTVCFSTSSPPTRDGATKKTPLNEKTDRSFFSRVPPPLRGEAEMNLVTISEYELRRIRGRRIAMIFQEPMTALSPVFTVGEQIREVVELHRGLRGRSARDAVVAALHEVGIPDAARRADEYPHQFSGGMRQRVMIAMALAGEPDLLIADEPTTALDVTVQQQILDLLQRLRAERGMGLLLITHDLGMVADVADDVFVMYAGRIVEHGSAREVLDRPLHPYTLGLLRCTPKLADRSRRWETIPGSVPDPANRATGCRFHPRCERSVERAREPGRIALPVKSDHGEPILRRCVESFAAEPSGDPRLREVRPNHFVACWEADGAV